MRGALPSGAEQLDVNPPQYDPRAAARTMALAAATAIKFVKCIASYGLPCHMLLYDRYRKSPKHCTRSASPHGKQRCSAARWAVDSSHFKSWQASNTIDRHRFSKECMQPCVVNFVGAAARSAHHSSCTMVQCAGGRVTENPPDRIQIVIYSSICGESLVFKCLDLASNVPMLRLQEALACCYQQSCHNHGFIIVGTTQQISEGLLYFKPYLPTFCWTISRSNAVWDERGRVWSIVHDAHE